ncbi:MAG: AAA family ATPase [Acidobacteriota bacterium]
MRARHYFALARRYATPLHKPTLIAVMGLSGTGKTTVARAIAGELGLRVLSSDAIRKSLFGKAGRPFGYGEGAYNLEANRLTYETLMAQSRTLLDASGGVILDATFQRAEDRAMAQAMAIWSGANWRLLECQLSPELVQSRLAARAAQADVLSAATWEVYLRQREQFEPFDNQTTGVKHLALDTSRNLAVISRAATDWLRENDQQGH